MKNRITIISVILIYLLSAKVNAQLSINISNTTNISCNNGSDGSIQVSGSKGKKPYYFSVDGVAFNLTNKFSNLKAGRYTLYVKDSRNDLDSLSVNLTEPSPLTYQDSIVSSNCPNTNDGSIFLNNIQGGTGLLAYNWKSASYVNVFSTRNITQIKSGIYYLEIKDMNGCVLRDTFNLKAKSPIALSITKDNITCNGKLDGKIGLSVLQTKNTYSVSWIGPNNFNSTSLNLSSLNQGEYTVTVTDDTSKCVITGSATIQKPAPLEVNVKNKRDVLCFGDSTGLIIPEIIGGTVPYIYNWYGPNQFTSSNSTITNGKKGTYTLVLTDIQGCTDTLVTVLNEPNRLLVSFSLTPVSCYGFKDGGIDLTVNGGLKPYDFQWSNGAVTEDISMVAAGKYEAIITDSNGCITKNNFTVVSPDPIVIDYTKTDISCYGKNDGRFTLIVSGGNFPLSYDIKTPSGASISTVNNRNVSSGIYRFYVSDAKNCKDSGSLSILEPDSLILKLNSTNPACYGLKGSLGVDVQGGKSPYTFQWLDSSGSLYSATQNVVTADVGSYYLTVKDANFCLKEDSVTITQPEPLSLSVVNVDNPSCAFDSTGAIGLAATGGSGSYRFKLSNTNYQTSNAFTNLKVGKYITQVQDASKCIDTAAVVVQNLDTLIPEIRVKSVTLYLNTSGETNLSTSDIDSGSTDNCGIRNFNISQSTFICSNVGTNRIYAQVTDLSGNSNGDSLDIIVLDTIKPTLRLKSTTVYLDATGKATLTVSQIDAGIFDNCKLDSIKLSQTNFDCADLGVNKILVTALDISGNIQRDTVLVSIYDTFTPVIITKNINVYLNNTGNVNISPTQVDNGSSDNCGIQSKILATTSFDCFNLGNNFVNYTLVDASNNRSNKLVRVTVFDTISPVVRTKAVTLYLNSFGFAVLKPEDVDNSSYDNCRITSMVLGQSVFTCTDLGEVSTTLTLTDGSGNKASANVKITVRDTLTPNVVTRNPTVFLDFNGNGVLSVFEVDKGSNDNCGLASIDIDQDKFTCNDLGEKTLTFTAKDASGNIDTGSFKVFIVDTMSPLVLIRNRDIYLDNQGKAQVTPAYFDVGTRDNCTLKSKVISKENYTLDDLGNNIVLFTATDQSGNRSVDVLNFKVFDTIAPVITVAKQIRYFDSTGSAFIKVSEIIGGVSDNTAIRSISLSDSVFNCSKLGTFEVFITAIDIANNKTRVPFILELRDSIRPRIVTKTAYIIIDTIGLARLNVSDVIDKVIENCELSSIILSKSIFGFNNEGSNFIEVQATDKMGNKSSTEWVEVIVSLGDSDNDSIPDYIETSLDFDGDGVPNYLDKDSDNDGVLDVIENQGFKILLDLDRDGFPNIYDLDSDGDRIFDVTETNGFDVEPLDGKVGIGKVTVDILTGIPVLANDGLGQPVIDTDNDNIWDFLDTDTDDDLILDFFERGNSFVPRDSDNDKIADYRDADSDNDGITDLIETNADNDFDGMPNYLDLDSDNDKIIDAVELIDDPDLDGLGNWIDVDSDGDGISDFIETNADFDNDGEGNWLDLDADNDGIEDNIEGINNSDNDIDLDFLDLDSDNDLIPDSIEGKPIINKIAVDTDGDGVPDYRDLDSDDDGIFDIDEGYEDTDGDGVLDFRDLDSDGDDLSDQLEGFADLDGDGIPNMLDRDSDGDGVWDYIETFVDIDGDRVPNCWDLDSDNDGINDLSECGYFDSLGNGLIKLNDTLELNDILRDSDLDGVPNFIDLDSDGDGISDLIESGNSSFDLNNNGMIDGPDTDGDGISNLVDGLSGAFGDLFDQPMQDFDFDGIPDFEDLDSDEDGILDEEETNNDVDFDGFGNYIDEDSDEDGIPDLIELNSDFDLDGIPNYIDLDSDGDGIPDEIEAGKDGFNPVDSDGDGQPDYLDFDSDNDGVSDKEEGTQDLDVNGVVDYLDPQIFVPEIFSPNGDGTNDKFALRGLNNFPNATLKVFNQWGQIVFDSKGPYQNNWDGIYQVDGATTSTQTLPEGVYFYIVDYQQDGGSKVKNPIKGNVYLKP